MADDNDPAADRGHPRYCLLILDDGGLVLATQNLIAGSDDDAMALASAMAGSGAVELWDGLRFIEHFAPLSRIRPDIPGQAEASPLSFA